MPFAAHAYYYVGTQQSETRISPDDHPVSYMARSFLVSSPAHLSKGSHRSASGPRPFQLGQKDGVSYISSLSYNIGMSNFRVGVTTWAPWYFLAHHVGAVLNAEGPPEPWATLPPGAKGGWGAQRP